MKLEALKTIVKTAAGDAVTISAIAGIAWLAYNGVTDPFVLTLMAGLGGYRAREKGKAAAAATGE